MRDFLKLLMASYATSGGGGSGPSDLILAHPDRQFYYDSTLSAIVGGAMQDVSGFDHHATVAAGDVGITDDGADGAYGTGVSKQRQSVPIVMAQAQPFTRFAIVKPDTSLTDPTPSSSVNLFCGTDGSTQASVLEQLRQNNNSPSLLIQSGGGGGSSLSGGPFTDYFLETYVWTGTQGFALVNGAVSSGWPKTPSGTLNGGAYWLFGMPANVNSSAFGWMKHCSIIFDALSDADRQAIEAMLATRHSLTVTTANIGL